MPPAKGILFRTSCLAESILFGNFSLDKGMLFGKFDQREVEFWYSRVDTQHFFSDFCGEKV